MSAAMQATCRPWPESWPGTAVPEVASPKLIAAAANSTPLVTPTGACWAADPDVAVVLAQLLWKRSTPLNEAAAGVGPASRSTMSAPPSRLARQEGQSQRSAGRVDGVEMSVLSRFLVLYAG